MAPLQHRKALSMGAMGVALLIVLVGGGCDPEPHPAPHDEDALSGDARDASGDCDGSACPAHAHCDPQTNTCVCDPGFEPLGGRCVRRALPDALSNTPGDAADHAPDTALPPDAEPVRDVVHDAPDWPDAHDETASLADAADISADGVSAEDVGADAAGDLCPVPQAPVLPIVHQGIRLTFTVEVGFEIEVGVAAGPGADGPDAWEPTDTVVLDTLGTFRVFARAVPEECREVRFAAIYEVREAYPPAAGQPESTAVSMNDAAILGWATGAAAANYGAEVDEIWQTPERAVGPAAGTSTDIVSLGCGGDITLTFTPPIADGPGYDFAVFENAFSDTFLELAYVEVSSDGVQFLRFDSVSLTDAPVAAFGSLDPTKIGGLAGTYRQGFGTPFDLASLRNRPEVHAGAVDLNAITHVRIVDIVGDGSALDSFGQPIWDPYPTTGSAGFDLDAIAVLNQ